MMTETWGAVAEEEIGLSILCTVTSRSTPERATIDGGSKTFAGDIAPGMVTGLTGYGQMVSADAYIEGMTEEHGLVRLGTGMAPEIGERLRFVPNHACTAVNLADEVIGVRNGQVEAIWPVLARGKRT
jgi:D-serine deaminase-like pyridoxal phosphate-dependent protein